MSVSLRKTPALLAVLELLTRAENPLWGLAIIKQTGYPSGTIYPLLDRLEHAGHVCSTWETDTGRSGPRRRLYRLSPDGDRWARAQLADAAAPRVRVAPKAVIA